MILSKCNYRYRLGYYKTKERALEVLDEIQNILETRIVPQMVHEMPLE